MFCGNQRIGSNFTLAAYKTLGIAKHPLGPNCIVYTIDIGILGKCGVKNANKTKGTCGFSNVQGPKIAKLQPKE